jgi:hypothetical protein
VIVDYFHVSVFPLEFSSVQINSNLLVVLAYVTSAKCSKLGTATLDMAPHYPFYVTISDLLCSPLLINFFPQILKQVKFLADVDVYKVTWFQEMMAQVPKS